MKYLMKFLDWLVIPSKTQEEKYLAQTKDVCDLERRIKDIQLGKTRNLPYI